MCLLHENRTNFHTARHTRLMPRKEHSYGRLQQGIPQVPLSWSTFYQHTSSMSVYPLHLQSHAENLFCYSLRVIRYLKLGKKEPCKTKGKKKNFEKKIAGWLVNTLKSTPAPTIKLISSFHPRKYFQVFSHSPDRKAVFHYNHFFAVISV